MKKKSSKKQPKRDEIKKIVYIAGSVFLIGLFLLFGCTEMSSSQAGLCYSLSTKSYANVPVCETEDSCFEKVSAMFKTNLGETQESNLYELKTHISRSWFFYNKALNRIKNAGGICQSTDYTNLPSELNEAQVYIEQSFLELDEGMKKSFEIVGAEETYLNKEKIDLIKEEKLYDSLVELRQIITELNSGSTNSESYVSYYLKKAESFSNSNISKGLPKLIEKQSILIEDYEFTKGSILKKLGVTDLFWFPTLDSAFENGLNYLENNVYSLEGITALKKFPVSNFTKLYSELGGNNTSALKRFADLINRTSENLESTNKETQSLWGANLKLQQSNKTILEEIKQYSKYSELYSKLLSAPVINEKNTDTQLTAESNNLLKLRESKSRGELRLGDELSKLKESILNLTQLQKDLSLQKENYSIKLTSACDVLAKNQKATQEITNADLLKLSYEVSYYSSKTLSAQGEEKLNYCNLLEEKSTLLQSALIDYGKFQAQEKDYAKECFAYTQKILSYGELSELNYEFDLLTKTEVTKETLTKFVEDCESIKMQAEYILREDESIIDCEKNFNEARNLIEKVREIEPYLSSQAIKSKVQTYNSQFEEYKQYFKEPSPKFESKLEEVFPIKKELLGKIKLLKTNVASLLKEELTEYSLNNLKVVQLTGEVVENSKEYNSLARLTIPNPFYSLNEEFEIELNFPLNEVTATDPCLKGLSQDNNKTTLILSCLQLGGMTLEFNQKGVLNTTETEEILFASNKESLIRRSIIVATQAVLPKVLLHTSLPKNTTKITALRGASELEGFVENKTFYFGLEEAKPNEEILVFFYIDGLIQTTTTLENSNTSKELNILTYSVRAENTYSKKLSATLSLDIPINSSVEEITIIKNGNELISEKIQSGKIILPSQSFVEKQVINYTIKMQTSTEKKYYLEEIEKQRKELLVLGNISEARKLEEVLSKGEENTLKVLSTTYFSTLELISKLKLTQQEKNNTENLKQNLFDKINDLQEQISELNDLGMEKEAKEIEELIKTITNTDLNNPTNLAKAFNLLSKKSFTFDETLKTNAEELLKKIKDMAKEDPTGALNELLSSFLEEKQQFEELISFDPLEGKKHYLNMTTVFEEFLSLKKEIDSNSTKELQETKKEIGQLKKANLELITELEYYFSKEPSLIKEKIIPPITQTRLAKLKLDLLDLNLQDSSLSEEKEKLIKIKEELQNAVDYLKREAIINFNLGIDKDLSREVLNKAKASIDSNNYADALILLTSANSTPLTPANFNFFNFIPIILLIIVAFVLKISFGKKDKSEEEKKKIILEEWKE